MLKDGHGLKCTYFWRISTLRYHFVFRDLSMLHLISSIRSYNVGPYSEL